jgi:hypothetical protein
MATRSQVNFEKRMFGKIVLIQFWNGGAARPHTQTGSKPIIKMVLSGGSQPLFTGKKLTAREHWARGCLLRVMGELVRHQPLILSWQMVRSLFQRDVVPTLRSRTLFFCGWRKVQFTHNNLAVLFYFDAMYDRIMVDNEYAFFFLSDFILYIRHFFHLPSTSDIQP